MSQVNEKCVKTNPDLTANHLECHIGSQKAHQHALREASCAVRLHRPSGRRGEGLRLRGGGECAETAGPNPSYRLVKDEVHSGKCVSWAEGTERKRSTWRYAKEFWVGRDSASEFFLVVHALTSVDSLAIKTGQTDIYLVNFLGQTSRLQIRNVFPPHALRLWETFHSNSRVTVRKHSAKPECYTHPDFSPFLSFFYPLFSPSFLPSMVLANPPLSCCHMRSTCEKMGGTEDPGLCIHREVLSIHKVSGQW